MHQYSISLYVYNILIFSWFRCNISLNFHRSKTYKLKIKYFLPLIPYNVHIVCMWKIRNNHFRTKKNVKSKLKRNGTGPILKQFNFYGDLAEKDIILPLNDTDLDWALFRLRFHFFFSYFFVVTDVYNVYGFCCCLFIYLMISSF